MDDVNQIYPPYLGRVINAYIESVVARASGSDQYDADAHAKAAKELDRTLARMAEADDMLDFMDDWCSGGQELVIAQSRRRRT